MHQGSGTTWVLVGLDSRADLPEGATEEQFGTTEEVPGSRADVVLVLHETDDGVRALSVPRDVVVRTGTDLGRLALTWLDGPQATVDALCALGIPADHVVAVDLAGFASVVDALGGLDVDVPAAVRDAFTGLRLDEAGPRHVDGDVALAMVRSRHPEHLVRGRWTPTTADPDGRAATAGAVLSALAGAGKAAAGRPWLLQKVAWAASGAISVDEGTSLADLATLARVDVSDVQVLPVGDPVGDTIARFPTPATTRMLTGAGMGCEG